MTFIEKLVRNREAYLSAKNSCKSLNKEVAARNNTKNVIVAKYDISSANKPHNNNFISSDRKNDKIYTM